MTSESRPAPRTVLTIAGSDPTGGAGLQADLQVFQAHGVHGMGVVTALTVQDSAKVHQVLPAFPSVVLDQLRVLLRDIMPDAIKVGMLATDDVLRNVLLALCEVPETIPLVIDPILQASDGMRLLERRAWPTLEGLFRRAALVTPNLMEAETLTGIDTTQKSGAEAAARHFVEEFDASAALVKGGHRDGPPDDVLAIRVGDDVVVEWLEGRRLDVGPVHGTGCALSAAIAARLALGDELTAAVEHARAFVASGLERAAAPGGGSRFLVHL